MVASSAAGTKASQADLTARIVSTAARWIYQGRRLDMQGLADELGVSRVTLFRRVGSREELISQALWRLTERMLEIAVERWEAERPEGELHIPGTIRHINAMVAGSAGLRRLLADEPALFMRVLTDPRGRGIAHLLDGYGRMYCDPDLATDVYTRQCSLRVSARDLAVMGATLANGGVNPVTGEQAIETRYCKRVLAVLATAGLYEHSGQWLYDVGLPGKSGVAGGIVTVSPGKGGLGTFSPPLDAAGNSVRGQHITRYLSEALGLNLFASAPFT